MAKEKFNNKASIEAILSAIRRYDFDRSEPIWRTARSIIANTYSISTKRKLASISITNDLDNQNLLSKVISIVNFKKGECLKIIQADTAITIIFNENKLEEITAIFPKHKIIRMDRNLAEINFHFPEESKKTPGILAAVSNEFMLNGVNIIDCMSCSTEGIWIIEEKDIRKSHDVIEKLSHPNSIAYNTEKF